MKEPSKVLFFFTKISIIHRKKNYNIKFCVKSTKKDEIKLQLIAKNPIKSRVRRENLQKKYVQNFTLLFGNIKTFFEKSKKRVIDRLFYQLLFFLYQIDILVIRNAKDYFVLAVLN